MKNKTNDTVENTPEQWLEGLNEEPIRHEQGDDMWRDSADPGLYDTVLAAREHTARRHEVYTTLTALRHRFGRTQTDVARAWKRSQSQVSKVEADPSKAELLTLAGYIEALGGHLTLEAEINGDLYRVDLL